MHCPSLDRAWSDLYFTIHPIEMIFNNNNNNDNNNNHPGFMRDKYIVYVSFAHIYAYIVSILLGKVYGYNCLTKK